MTRIRVLLVDDHETVREGLKAVLGAHSDIEIVGEAANGLDAVAAAARLLPDVVVMDVSIPDLNGLEATERIVRQNPATRLLVLTRHSDGGYVQALLRAGASGYVLKQSRTTELLRAIHAIAEGGIYLDPMVAAQALPRPSRASAAEAQDLPDLSPREEEVLKRIAWGYSNKDIASQLGLSVKTVEAHRANAGHKLKLASRAEIVRFALLRGWLQDRNSIT